MKQYMNNRIYVCLFSLLSMIGLFSCQSAMDEWMDSESHKNFISTKSADLVEKSVEVKEAGTLDKLLTADEMKTVEKLIISGNLNATDVNTFREKLPYLKVLDLKKVTFVENDKLTYHTDWGDYKVEKTTISNLMFARMRSLVSLILPEDVVVLKESAFRECSSLESVEMPKHITSVGHEVFGQCIKLQSVDLTNFKELGSSMFSGCNNLTSVILPSGLKIIPRYCFQGTGDLKIDIPSSVETIDESAFYYSNISSIKVPEKVINLGSLIFHGCKNLKEVTFLANLKTLPEGMFMGCTSLVSMEIPSSVTSIGASCFNGCSNLETVKLPDKLLILEKYVFAGCERLASISIPNTIIEIREHAFWLCRSLTSISIPSSVTSLGSYVFNSCYGLTTVTIPATVTYVENGAFYDTPNLTSIFWKPNMDVVNEIVSLNESNCLFYLSHDVKCNATWKNVILSDNTATEIVLREGHRYQCPRKFTTNKISYTRRFDKSTYLGQPGGWESIILPFKVTTILDEDGNEIAPFAANNANVKKHFWLRELAADGTYKNVTTIEANKPYIIAMPNSDVYDEAYRIKGEVTFKSKNTTLEVTADIAPIQGAGFVMQGTYNAVAGTRLVYALNKNHWYDGDASHTPGSIWVASLHDITPFEAYLKNVTATARGFVSIGGTQTRASHSIGRKPSVTDM